jgi:hypothetical protein
LRVRTTNGFAGVPIETWGHPDAFCQELQRQVVQAEFMQTAERTRGMHRGPGEEFLSLHLDDVLTDITYDSVIRWPALAVDERGSLLQGRGLAPERPADLVTVGQAVLGDTGSGGLFTNRKQAEKATRRSVTEGALPAVADANRNGDIGVREGIYIGVCRRSGLQTQPHSPLPRLFDFSAQNVLHGKPGEHPLLAVPNITVARLDIAKCAPAMILVDPDRIRTVADVRRRLPRTVTGITIVSGD